MNARLRDLWLIPFIVSVVGGLIVGVPLMIYAAWYSEHAPHSLVNWASVREALHSPITTGTVLLLGAIPLLLLFLFVRIRTRNIELTRDNRELQRQMSEADAKYNEEVARLRKPEPKVHVVWNPAQTFWHRGAIGLEPAMQIGGWALSSSSDTDETLILRIAYIEGTVPRGMLPDVTVEPGIAKDEMIMTFVTPVIEPDETKAVTARLVLEDHKNRKYVLPAHTFRATPQPVPAAIREETKKPIPPAPV